MMKPVRSRMEHPCSLTAKYSGVEAKYGNTFGFEALRGAGMIARCCDNPSSTL